MKNYILTFTIICVAVLVASCAGKAIPAVTSTPASPASTNWTQWQSRKLQSPATFGYSIIQTIGKNSYLIYSVSNGIIICSNHSWFSNPDPREFLGIAIVDVSDSDHPKETYYLKSNHDNKYNEETGIQLIGSTLYITTKNYLWIINVTDPYHPEEIGTMPLLGGYGLAISGHYAFMISGSDSKTIITLDISDAGHPVIIGKLNTQSTINKIMVSGDSLLALSNRELDIIDVSTPGQLKNTGILPNPFPPLTGDTAPEFIPPYFLDMTIDNSNIYIVSGINKLLAIDISNPSAPAIAANIGTQEQGTAIITSRKYAYLLSSNGAVSFSFRESDSLIQVDISDPTKPLESGSKQLPQSTDPYSQGYFKSISVINGYLYLTSGVTPTIELLKLKNNFTQ